MSPNIVIRQCRKCGHAGEEQGCFGYMGIGVWACDRCGGKYTFVRSIIDPDSVKCERGGKEK